MVQRKMSQRKPRRSGTGDAQDTQAPSAFTAASRDSALPSGPDNTASHEASISQPIQDKARDDETPQKLPFRLVGVGASAGGLEALGELLESLPISNTLCYVIAQHVSPTHESMLSSLLSPKTELHVKNLTDGQIPEPGHIYITPPNKDVTLDGIKLRLTEPRSPIGPKPCVDLLLQSMAEQLGEHCAAIILSGTGSDGALGIRAIKAAGGYTLAQDPATAKYDGMPKAAIQTGSVDLILAPAKMGAILDQLGTVPYQALLNIDNDNASSEYVRVCDLVHSNTNFSLNEYKPATVRRRIARRMNIVGVQTLKEYIELLLHDRSESFALVRDTFIGVTSFFRDPEAFTALEAVLTEQVAHYETGKLIRCWIPGCSTGEEVFSIAMVFESILRKLKKNDIQFLIFATDMDEDAIERARSAVYSVTELAHIPTLFHEPYLELLGDHFRISKHLRNRVVFAKQNVIDDPPFGRLDLVSCRNLLIYLNPDTQKKVMEVFHYSLLSGGVLFLGKSETVESHDGLFKTINRQARLYSRIQGISHYILPSTRPTQQTPRTNIAQSREDRPLDRISQSTLITLAAHYAPPSVVINEEDFIVHFQGDLKPFLEFPQGRAAMYIFDLVDHAFRAELRALVYRCRREVTSVNSNPRSQEYQGDTRWLSINVRPLEEKQAGHLLVSFLPLTHNAALPTAIVEPGEDHSGLIIRELEKELANTRTHLNVVVEELETSNAELQSLNEELQSANAEMQSTNEELQTSNEELQSTNEELLTVNDEIQVKTGQLETLFNDLTNVKESLTFPMMVVDASLRITQINSACATLVKFEGPMEGASMLSLRWKVEIPGLASEIRSVIENDEHFQTIALDLTGNVYSLQIMPYHDSRGKTDGAVLVFENITLRYKAEQALRTNEARFRLMATCVKDYAIFMLDPTGRVASWNEGVSRIKGYCENEVLGMPMSIFYTEEDRTAYKPALLLQQALQNGSAEDEGWRLRKDGTRFYADVIITPVYDDQKLLLGFVKVTRDISERRAAQEALRNSERRFREVVESLPQLVWTCDAKGACDYLSPQWVAYTGIDAATQLKFGWAEQIHPDDREKTVEQWMKSAQTGQAYEHHFRIRRNDGHYRWFRTIGVPLRDQDNNITKWFGSCTDIHQLKQNQDTLQSMMSRLTMATKAAEIGIWTWDLQSNQLLWDDRLCDLYETPQALREHGITYEFWRSRCHPDDVERTEAELNAALRGEKMFDTFFRIVLPDNSIRHIQSAAVVESEIAGKPARFVGINRDITDEALAAEALKESESTVNQIIDLMPSGVLVINEAGTLIRSNQRLLDIFGYSKEELLGKSIDMLLMDNMRKEHVRHRTAYNANPRIRAMGTGRDLYGRHRDGHEVLVDVALTPYNRDGERYTIAAVSDISYRREAENELRLSAKVFDNTLDGIAILTPSGTITKLNHAFESITGFGANNLLGTNFEKLIADQSDIHIHGMWEAVNENGSWKGELWLRHLEGRLVPVWLNMSILRNTSGNIERYICTLYDITEQKISQERINYLAHYDVLTGLANRTLFSERFSQALSRAKRQQQLLAILFIDLDNFKHINDSYGHSAGDELLCKVAERLKAAIRKTDTLARLSGDEFMILFENTAQESNIRVATQKILSLLTQPLDLGGKEFVVSASVGIACYPSDGQDMDTLLKNADLAMYRAKESGRNQFHFYSEEMSEKAHERILLQNDLRRALDHSELTLHYQPVVQLDSKRCAGAEALARWNHPTLGWVPPSKFVSIAEENVLIHQLGEWALRSACNQFKQWLDSGTDLEFLSINVSGKQIMQSDFVSLAKAAFTDTGCPPEKIVIELTESFVMRESEGAIKRLQSLRDLGVNLAIDDFGTGYSSLSYLKRLPINKLKLDQSFVRDLSIDANDRAIARAILRLSEAVDIGVVAEGVETIEQNDFLISEGCLLGQGYLHAKPMPANDLLDFLSRQPAAA